MYQGASAGAGQQDTVAEADQTAGAPGEPGLAAQQPAAERRAALNALWAQKMERLMWLTDAGTTKLAYEQWAGCEPKPGAA